MRPTRNRVCRKASGVQIPLPPPLKSSAVSHQSDRSFPSDPTDDCRLMARRSRPRIEELQLSRERSPSGLGRSPGKRVGVTASWVQIPPSPPSNSQWKQLLSKLLLLILAPALRAARGRFRLTPPVQSARILALAEKHTPSFLYSRIARTPGGVSEWFMVAVLKTAARERRGFESLPLRPRSFRGALQVARIARGGVA